MRSRIGAMLLAVAVAFVPLENVTAQADQAAQSGANQIESFEVAEHSGGVIVRLGLRDPLVAPPASFSVANPARIAFDFQGVANALGRNSQVIDQGDLRSANIVQVGDRTRVVLSLVKVPQYEARVEGKNVIIEIAASGSNAPPTVTAESHASFAEAKAQTGVERSLRDVTFRRGQGGEGRVVVQLSNPDTGIDIRQQGGGLIVEFQGTTVPEHLRRKADVTDFGTPVTSMVTQQHGDKVRVVVTPNGLWEHNAYQSDDQFVLEVRRVIEDPNKLVQGTRGQYQGEKLSLNFQNIDVRSVLQVIADFTNFNIITSDSVQGNLTLRLKDVPWDQALDIILQAKGLDKRKDGNVVWIAPSDELSAREKLQLEAKSQIVELEPLLTESFQINYHKAKEIAEFLKNKDQSQLSKRGSASYDERSNKVFVTDVASQLQSLRRLVQEIDVAPRQVLIEARIVEAEKNFARDLGVRLGLGGALGRVVGYDSSGAPIRQGTIGGGLGATQVRSGASLGGDQRFTQVGSAPITSVLDANPGGLNVNLPSAAANSGALSMVLWNNSATRFLNLELSALEADGRGRVVSSPRVLTANQVEALIEQGTEIPYLEASSSGATSVAFKSASLRLKVKPQITPEGNLQLTIEVNKDRPIWENALMNVPPIETKKVRSEVLIDNGGTVVIGGIYLEEDTSSESRIPVLGELPVVGSLFRTRSKVSNQKELLVFITPRIVAEALTLK